MFSPSSATPAPAAASASFAVERREPMMVREPGKMTARCAESAGETAAECVAICCCCPCVMVNLIVVVVVKIPVRLIRRAIRRCRTRKKRKPVILWTRASTFEEDDFGIRRKALLAAGGNHELWPARRPSEEVLELEKTMWASFHGAGFWRSPSQKEKLISSLCISEVKEQ